MNDQVTRLLPLETPALTLATLSLVNANKNDFKAWLKGLSLLNLGDSARQLFITLKELSILNIDDQLRFELVELLRPPIRTIISSMSRQYYNQSLNLDQRADRIANLVQSFLSYQIIVYDSISERCAQQLNKTTFGLFNIKQKKGLLQLFGLASHRSLSELCSLIFELQMLYQKLPEGFWLKAHSIYLRAKHLNVVDSEFEDSNNTYVTKLSIERVYAHLIIMGVINSNKLRQNEVKAIYQFSEFWSAYLSLSSDETPYHTYTINPHIDSPPIFITKAREASKDSLFVNTQHLFQHFKGLVSANPHYAHPAEQKNLSNSLRAHLLHNFSSSAERAHKRHNYTGTVEISFGILSAHYHLSGGKSFETIINIQRDYSLPKEFLSMHNFGQVEADMDIEFPSYQEEKKAKLTTEQVELYQCEVVNISPGGYCLRWRGDSPTVLRTGELLILREPSDNIWHIGLIRWVNQTAKKQLEFGLEIISSRGKPCGIRALQKNDEIDSFKRAILLPEIQSLNRPATIIAPAFAFHSNQNVLLRYGNEEIQIHLNDKYLITQSFIQFQYSLIEKEYPSTNVEKKHTIDQQTSSGFEDEVWNIL